MGCHSTDAGEVTGVLRIDPEQWMHSATRVTTQGESLATGHFPSPTP